jgi:hypothetical protein
MDSKVKWAVGAGLLAVVAALGYGGYQCAKYSPIPTNVCSTPVGDPFAQQPPSSSAINTSGMNGASVNPNQINGSQSSTALTPAAAPLAAQSGVYASAPPVLPKGSAYESTTTETREYGQNAEVPVAEKTTTTTSVKTAYVPPSVTVHHVHIQRRVKHEKPGNVHVGRAVKHTVGFTANLPKRLRF